jgi:4-hydroxybenzoate polyprenyltransferase
MSDQISTFSIRRVGHRLQSLGRAGEWWGYKLSPILATAYATVSLSRLPLWPFLSTLGLLLLALAIGAVYVSILNDWTDRAIDRAAGKVNRLSGKSAGFVGVALSLCIGIGLGFGYYFWSLDPVISFCYLGAWVAYSLYSIPPARLKIRGFAGVLADASGAHLFPQLLTIAFLSHATRQTVPVGWWLAVGGWSLACGLRNILWHQLSDVAADRQAGIDTYVTRLGEQKARQVGRLLIFPIEGLTFTALLLLMNQPIPVVALLLYGLLEAGRWRLWGLKPEVLAPNQRIILNEYYTLLFPLSILIGQTLTYPADGVLLLLHLLLFGTHSPQTWRDLGAVVRLMVRKLAGR